MLSSVSSIYLDIYIAVNASIITLKCCEDTASIKLLFAHPLIFLLAKVSYYSDVTSFINFALHSLILLVCQMIGSHEILCKLIVMLQ